MTFPLPHGLQCSPDFILCQVRRATLQVCRVPDFILSLLRHDSVHFYRRRRMKVNLQLA
jgi:hypothetical protein